MTFYCRGFPFNRHNIHEFPGLNVPTPVHPISYHRPLLPIAVRVEICLALNLNFRVYFQNEEYLGN